MTRRRRLLYASLAAVVAAAFLAPTAAAYINPPTPRTTFAVERTAFSVPVTDMAVVKITRPTGLGTGFHIGGGKIVTAAHVVVGAQTVSLKTEDGRYGSARVVSVDEKTDVAILQTNMSIMATQLDCGTVPVGTAISAVGNPMGIEFVTSFGMIASAPRSRKDMEDREYYITDMTTIGGQSGGPVFAGGRVIGVVSAVLMSPSELVGNVVPGAGVYSRSPIGFGLIVPSGVVCKMLAAGGGEGDGL